MNKQVRHFQCCICGELVSRRSGTQWGKWSTCPACGATNLAPGWSRVEHGAVVVTLEQIELFDADRMARRTKRRRQVKEAVNG